MKLLKTRKGISPIIATVLLILIAIATGVVIYAFMAGWIGTRFSATSGPQAVLIVESGYWNGTHFILYVRNDGSRNTNITRAYIEYPNGTVYLVNKNDITDINGHTAPLIPANGTAIEVLIKGPTDIQQGVVYTIKLVGNDGSEVTTRIRA